MAKWWKACYTALRSCLFWAQMWFLITEDTRYTNIVRVKSVELQRSVMIISLACVFVLLTAGVTAGALAQQSDMHVTCVEFLTAFDTPRVKINVTGEPNINSANGSLFMPQLISKQYAAQRTLTAVFNVVASLSPMFTTVALLLAMITLFHAQEAKRQQKKDIEGLSDTLGELKKQADEQEVMLVRQKKVIPDDIEILVPVDLSSPSTGTWGSSLLQGVKEYFREKGHIIQLGEQIYR